jgi:hypothetical protein
VSEASRGELRQLVVQGGGSNIGDGAAPGQLSGERGRCSGISVGLGVFRVEDRTNRCSPSFRRSSTFIEAELED